MSSEPVQTVISPEDEAEIAFKFYDKIMQLCKDNHIAETLTVAYIQSFERRLG